MVSLATIRRTLEDIAIEASAGLKHFIAQLPRHGGYIAFGFVIFLLVAFAQYCVRDANTLISKATNGGDPVSVELGPLAPTFFPPGAATEYIVITDTKTGAPVFLLQDATIKVGIIPMLIGKITLDIEGRAYGGMTTISLATGALFNVDWIKTMIRLDMAELEKMPALLRHDRTITGLASIQAEYEGEWRSPSTMRGAVHADLRTVNMANTIPMIRTKRLKDCVIIMDFTQEEDTLTMAKFRVQGEGDITLEATGALRLDREDTLNSKLTMAGKITAPPRGIIHEAFAPNILTVFQQKGFIPISLSGTIKNPKMQMQ